MKNFKILMIVGVMVFLSLVSCHHYQRVYDQELFFMDNPSRPNSIFIKMLQKELEGQVFSEIRYVMENRAGKSRIMVVYGFDIQPPAGMIIKSVIVQILGQ